MLKIRIRRVGKKNKPFYKIVVAENLSKRNGKSVADIGYYNPFSNSINFKNALLYKFINLGALPTNTVRHLIFKTLKKDSKF
jgi:small subunit ribosomal protein S16